MDKGCFAKNLHFSKNHSNSNSKNIDLVKVIFYIDFYFFFPIFAGMIKAM